MKTFAKTIMLIVGAGLIFSVAPDLMASANDCATTVTGTTTSGRNGATQKDTWSPLNWCSGSGCKTKFCLNADGSSYRVCTNDDTCALPTCCKLILQMGAARGKPRRGYPKPKATGNCTTPGCTSPGVCQMRVTRPAESKAGPISAQPECTTKSATGTSSTLIGMIWHDIDGNKQLDPGEFGFPGVLVTLIEAGPDEEFLTPDDLVADMTFSIADGSYEFTGFEFGYYRIQVDDVTGPLGGLMCTTDNHPLHIVLYEGQIVDEGVAFGYH